MTIHVVAIRRVMWFSVRWRSWRGAGAVLTNTGMSAIHLVTTVFLKPGDLLVRRTTATAAATVCLTVWQSAAVIASCLSIKAMSRRCGRRRKNRSWCWWKVQATLLRVVDIAKICQLAREAGAVSVVDNTFLSPALQNHWRWAPIWCCIHAKYLMVTPTWCGVVIAKDPETVTELAWWANNIGVTGGAFDSYLLLRGLYAVSAYGSGAAYAQAIVEYLKTQPLVKKLYHPSLPENQGHEIAASAKRLWRNVKFRTGWRRANAAPFS
jgi:cystathionine gamma-synthase